MLDINLILNFLFVVFTAYFLKNGFTVFHILNETSRNYNEEEGKPIQYSNKKELIILNITIYRTYKSI